MAKKSKQKDLTEETKTEQVDVVVTGAELEIDGEKVATSLESEETYATKKEIRWDLLAVVASERKEDQEQVQVALQAGYEPFCVVPHVIPNDTSTILNPNQPSQPKFANLVWMKRGVLVDVRE